MQSPEQAQGQSKRRPPPTNDFKPGRSGNPSGKTRQQIRTAEFTELFRTVHEREPSAADLATLRAAGRTCARLEGRGLTPDQIAKLSNTLRRDLRRLKLEVQDNAQEQPQSSDRSWPTRKRTKRDDDT